MQPLEIQFADVVRGGGGNRTGGAHCNTITAPMLCLQSAGD